jgi:Protein of unknown function (DUF1761)
VTVNMGVNYLAVIVAAIVAVAIGILYYGILGVGDRQSRMLGISPARPGPLQGATGLIVGLVNAWVIAVLSLTVGAASLGDAIALGALVWLGFGATFKAAQVAFERRPWALWAFQAVHDLVVEVVVAAIVTLWR